MTVTPVTLSIYTHALRKLWVGLRPPQRYRKAARRLFPFILLQICLICLPAAVHGSEPADGESVTIDADQLRYDQERRLFVAEGNVVILMEETRVTCNYAEYSDLTGSFAAKGDVTFTDEEGIVLCEQVEGNARTGLWTFYEAEMDNVKRGYLLTGKQIDKIGDESYLVKRGTISECGKIRPVWEMRGNKVWITRGRNLRARDMVFRLGGVPLFYFPYFWYPLTSGRQSGFLPPLLGQGGRNGTSVELDYFWAIDTDRDATFSFEYLEDNGNRLGLEFRYAISRDVGGSIFGKYIHDRNADRDDSRIGMNQDRWEAGITHFYNQRDRLYGGAFVDVFSDGFYLQDFSRSSEARVQNNGQSDVALAWRRPSGNATVDFRYYQVMGVRRNTATLQSLPELRLDLPGARLGNSNWFYALESSFVNFYRQEGYSAVFSSEISSDPLVLDPVTPGQVANLQKLEEAGFNDKTALRHQGVRGRRLDLSPSLSLPLDLTPNLVFTPNIGYRETMYSRGPFEKDFVDRGLLQTGFDADTKLHRNFQLGASKSLRHIVEPGLSYLYRTGRSQDKTAIYDELDQAGPLDEIRLRLINRLISTTLTDSPGAPIGNAEGSKRELATLKLECLYDRRQSNDKFRSITGELDVNLSDNYYFETNALYDFHTDSLEQLNLDLKFRKGDDFTFQVGRQYTRRVPVNPNQPIGTGRQRFIGSAETIQALDNDGIHFWTGQLHWEASERISLDFSGYFNAEEDEGEDLSFQINYARKCWGVAITWERYDDSVFNDGTQQFDVDKVNEVRIFFTIKSLRLGVFERKGGLTEFF
jgi:LPS-assembly protein